MPLLKEGGVFPPEEDQARLRRYRDAAHLYEGSHANHYKAHRIRQRLERTDTSINGISASGIVYIVFNLPRLIVQKHADLLVLREPIVRLDTEADTEAFNERLNQDIPQWRGRVHQFLQLKRAFGDGLLIPKRSEDGRVDLRVYDPRNWYPVRSSADPLEIEVHQFAWVEEQHGDDAFLRVDYCLPDGSIERKAFLLEGDPNRSHGDPSREYQFKIRGEVALNTHWGELAERDEPVEGIDGFACVHVPNGQSSDPMSPFGRSDFEDSGGLFDNTNEALSKWSRANDKVAQVPRAVPHKYLRVNQTTNKAEAPSLYEENFYVQNPTREAGSDASEIPQWITVSLGHETLKDEFIESVKATLIRQEMSPALLGFEQGNEKESGDAKALGMVSTETSARRDLLVVRPGVDRALSNVAALADMPGEVSSHWQVGLPKSDAERQAEVMSLLSSGLITKKDALSMLFPQLTPDQVKERLEELTAERDEELRRETAAFAEQG